MLMSLSTVSTTRRCIAQETFCVFVRVINVTIIIIIIIIKLLQIIMISMVAFRGHFLRERVGTEYPYLLNAWERRSHTSRENVKKLAKSWESFDFATVNCERNCSNFLSVSIPESCF